MMERYIKKAFLSNLAFLLETADPRAKHETVSLAFVRDSIETFPNPDPIASNRMRDFPAMARRLYPDRAICREMNRRFRTGRASSFFPLTTSPLSHRFLRNYSTKEKEREREIEKTSKFRA